MNILQADSPPIGTVDTDISPSESKPSRSDMKSSIRGVVALLCLVGTVMAQQTLQNNCGKDPCEKAPVKKPLLKDAKVMASDKALVPLRNYVPLVGEEVYDPKKKCCMENCECHGQASCCAKKLVKIVSSKIVKRGELPQVLVDHSPRDTQTVKSLGEEPAKEPGQFSKSPLYPRKEESKTTITKSTLPETDRSHTKHVGECDCCFKATVPTPITPCNCCGRQQ